jgi:recombination protein RecA
MAAKAAPRPDEEFDEHALVELLAEEYGEETVALGKPVPARDYISTQSASLDYAIGRPGIPVGAVTNIFGPEGSGKSTVVNHILAETQRRGGFAVLYDSEGAYDIERGRRMGIDYERLIMLEPDNLERVFDQVEKIVSDVSQKRPDTLITIAIDSVAGAPTKAMLEGSFGDAHPASQAKAVSQALPVLVQKVRRTQTALILVGQLRAKLEFSPIPGQQKETQVAEGSIRYYSHLRLRFQKAGEVGEKGSPTGIWTLGYTAKNKTAPPFRTAKFIIDFWSGIDKAQSALDVAQKIGLVQMRGGWYRYGDRSFRADDFADVLASSEELQAAIAHAPESWIDEMVAT